MAGLSVEDYDGHAVTEQTSNPSARAWTLPATRSVAALVVGIPVAFIPHTIQVGLGAAGAFFVLTAAALALFARSTDEAAARFGVLAAITGLAAVAAAIMLAVAPEPWALIVLVVAWALASAAVEFTAARGSDRRARDWRTVAVATAAFGVLFALTPLLGIADPVSLTGFFGAYAAIVGVFHAIAAASLAFGARLTQASAAEPQEVQP